MILLNKFTIEHGFEIVIITDYMFMSVGVWRCKWSTVLSPKILSGINLVIAAKLAVSSNCRTTYKNIIYCWQNARRIWATCSDMDDP